MKSCNFLILFYIYIYTLSSLNHFLISVKPIDLFENDIMESDCETSSPSRPSPIPSSPSYSRPTSSSSSSEAWPESPPSKRCRFDGPSRNPSPVRCPPLVRTDNNPYREERRSLLYSPWKNPVPDFVPEPRAFIPGVVKSPTDWLESLSQEDNKSAMDFIKKIKIQHEACVTRHNDLFKELQRIESDIRRLEAEPKNWPKVGLDKICPMPIFMRDYFNSLQAKKD